ncbi:hypothetical protein ONS95_014609 [Cadophora gregata]|uniref:uncharacterized protein n=1 Tax=Cadophora gregata TaxID=51156 RepID=UPI0026DC1F57|nr:uncharacterized protein ONS95_014609 [Cadophora gregata]KAK0112888.1 hypothetical protein ONS95_014609 [Cadophora gregata]KAK0125016.1 hypothetical protein ONS96_008883 [Cadophora gregata f. sp. sojae]
MEPPPDYSEHPQQLTDIDLKMWIPFAQGDNMFFNYAVGVSRRMGLIGERLFCGTRTAMRVEFWDIKPVRGSILGRPVNAETIHDIGSMNTYLKENLTIGIRTISIHANSPNSPLSITAEAMNVLLTQLRVGPQFLDLLFSFAGHGKDVEAGSGSLVYKYVANGPNVAGILEVQYILRYPILTNDNTWIISQTAVYHRHVLKTHGSFWILLHSDADSPLQARLQACMRQWERSHSYVRDGFDHVHFLALSSYLGEWRWFLLDLEKEVEALDTSSLSLLHNTSSTSHSDSTQTRLHIENTTRTLHRRIAPLKPILESTLQTVKNLGVVAGKPPKMADEFRTYEVMITGYLAAVEGLRGAVERVGRVRGDLS